ncbi:MAG: energy-coupling factor ABC transporter ATP-binding protein [Fimbriiglobus sp.]
MKGLDILHLNHAYPDGRAVLRDLSFHVEPGERVALVGPNGAGKTTLFLRIAGILTGSLGQVIWNGHDPSHPAQKREMPKYVGIVFQNPDDQLFAPTLLEDVSFGPLNLGLSRDEAVARAEASLSRVGLPGAGSRTPHKLSGGEKRRAAIAGVLAMEPELWLWDEPSMYLDPRGRRELIGLIGTLPGTMLIATHDLRFAAETCQRVLILDDGQLAADGPITLFQDTTLLQKHGLEV